MVEKCLPSPYSGDTLSYQLLSINCWYKLTAQYIICIICIHDA